MATIFNVHCMLCGRRSGQVRDGTFQRLASAPPLRQRGNRSRCGFCDGSLYLEAEDSPFARQPDVFEREAALVQAGRVGGRRRAS